MMQPGPGRVNRSCHDRRLVEPASVRGAPSRVLSSARGAGLEALQAGFDRIGGRYLLAPPARVHPGGRIPTQEDEGEPAISRPGGGMRHRVARQGSPQGGGKASTATLDDRAAWARGAQARSLLANRSLALALPRQTWLQGHHVQSAGHGHVDHGKEQRVRHELENRRCQPYRDRNHRERGQPAQHGVSGLSRIPARAGTSGVGSRRTLGTRETRCLPPSPCAGAVSGHGP